MRLRQVAWVAKDLDAAEEEMSSALGAEVCFRDPGVGAFGLRNALFAIGDTFCEIVSPIAADTAAGRYLQRRRGDGGYMVLLQADEDERAGCRARAAAAGIREVWQASDTHDGTTIVGTHFHPGDLGGAILSIDTAVPPDSWGWAGSQWETAVGDGPAGSLLGVEIQTEEPEKRAVVWGDLLGIRPDAGHQLVMDDGSRVQFVPLADHRGEGISGVSIASLDEDRAGSSSDLVGVRIDWR
ncbi:MAG: hypothetical protein ACK5PP_08070 [Acidimicrobiales bacterium]